MGQSIVRLRDSLETWLLVGDPDIPSRLNQIVDRKRVRAAPLDVPRSLSMHSQPAPSQVHPEIAAPGSTEEVASLPGSVIGIFSSTVPVKRRPRTGRGQHRLRCGDKTHDPPSARIVRPAHGQALNLTSAISRPIGRRSRSSLQSRESEHRTAPSPIKRAARVIMSWQSSWFSFSHAVEAYPVWWAP